MAKYVCKNQFDNLCDTCEFCIADCMQQVTFGTGLGNDNVIMCTGYFPTEEIPEYVEVIND
jgi:hypothetical protein